LRHSKKIRIQDNKSGNQEKMDSSVPTEQIPTESHIPSESVDIVKKAERVLSEKQREALKAGREKRWKRMFEALENQAEQQLTRRHSLSSSSDSSESGAPPEPIKSSEKEK